MRRIAVDTETTGLELRHDCSVYCVSIAYEAWKGEPAKIDFFEFDVEPSTRKVLIDQKKAEQVRQIVENPEYIPIFANAKFDVLGLEKSCKINPYQVLRRCRDVIMESHLLNSSESHGIKDTALKYAGIGTEDVDAVQKVTNLARAEARSINAKMKKKGFQEPFKIGGPDCFYYTKRQPTGGWWIVDTWLSKAVHKFKLRTKANSPRLAEELWGKDWKKVIAESSSKAAASQAYCDTDSTRTLVLDTIFMDELDKHEDWLNVLYNIQFPQLEVAYRMESFGVGVNLEEINRKIAYFDQKKTDRYSKAIKLSGNKFFNPASGKQLQKLIYEDWGTEVKKWTKPTDNPEHVPGPATDIDALCTIIKDQKEYPGEFHGKVGEFCRNIIVGSKCETAISYLEAYRNSAQKYHLGANSLLWHRLNPSFNPTGTKTTRYSGSNPNPTNISKGKKPFDILDEILEGENMSLRGVFGPMPGREWYTADFKQIQLAVFAYQSQDPEMMEAVEAGRDFHNFMQRKIFADRYIPEEENKFRHDDQKTIAKNVNFGFTFGAGDEKIETTSKMPGLMDTLREMFPAVAEYMRKISGQVRRSGLVYAGPYPLQVDQDKPYIGVNYIVQGFEGIIVKEAMIECHDYLMERTQGEGQLTLMVHDELVFDFPQGMGEHHVWNLRQIMLNASLKYGMKIGVDFKYTITNWADMMKVVFDEAA